MGKRTRKFIHFVILLTILAIIFTIFDRRYRRNDQPLKVSGTIEAVEVTIAFEIGGKIDQILVKEGDKVQTGDVVARLEDEMLQAQFESTQAALDQAQANYLLMAAQPLAEERDARISVAQLDLLNAHQSLKDLVENAGLARANAEQALEDAENALEDLLDSDLQQSLTLEAIAKAEKDIDGAEKRLAILTKPPSQSAIDQAYANMLLADDSMTQTIQDIELAEGKLRRGLGPNYPKNIVDDYKKQLRGIIQNLEIKLSRDQLGYENSVHKYNQLLSPVDPVELALAEAELAMAEAQLGQRQREYDRVKDGPSPADIAVLEARIVVSRREFEALQDGPDPSDLALAQAGVHSAEAHLSLAQADSIQEQLDAAKAQVDSARAALGVIQTQLDKLVLTAPADGVVLSRAIEPGEVIKPGTNAITIGLLDELSITVYIPEVYYSIVQGSDEVRIALNAYPGKLFSGRVIRIVDESDFVARNIERSNGGRDAVFAVKIAVHDAGLLKPGMLAKVEFTDQ